MTINKQILFTLFILILSIVFFELTTINILVQDTMFDYETHQWILDAQLQPYKFIFYDGIKTVLILFASSLLIALIFFRNKKTIKEYKKGMIVVILSAIIIPLVIGSLKKCTNMPCPKNEIHYGGIYPSTKVWESYPESFTQLNTIKCWPAGHASGGFALLSLFFLFKTRKNKTIALIGALGIGWSMGIYKMLIGDHFLGHTVITMIIAWLIVLLLSKAMDKVSKQY